MIKPHKPLFFDTEIKHGLNEQINSPVTETEITDAIKTLENNK